VRLEQLTPSHVRRAVDLYMQRAWPDKARANPWFDPGKLEGISTVEELLKLFTPSSNSEDGPACHRYTLRLGNSKYPFMKFVLQEYLVAHEYFFSVDTHDDLDIPEGSPDHAAWLDLRAQNMELKQLIEGDWSSGGLPTNSELCMLVEAIAKVEGGAQRCGRLLVVDDEEEVAKGLKALLSARGYQVEVAFDGQQVLDRLAEDPLPDLVLLDLNMPRLNGDEVLDAMRASSRLADVPVLMATASSIDLQKMQRVSGLLRKPYPRQLLFKMIEQLLESH
jgi:CheY-like chemotaxis protein